MATYSIGREKLLTCTVVERKATLPCMYHACVCVCLRACVSGCTGVGSGLHVGVWLGVVCKGGCVDNEMESSFCTMVMVRVSVHPAGLGPREAGKAWYSRDFITEI